MRNQKGATFIEVLIVAVIVGIIAAIAIPSLLRAKVFTDFNEYFGVQLPSTSLTPDQKAILKPVVDRRLEELKQAFADASAEYRQFRGLPPAATPAEAQERLKKCEEILTRMETTGRALGRAAGIAKELGLFTDSTGWQPTSEDLNKPPAPR